MKPMGNWATILTVGLLLADGCGADGPGQNAGAADSKGSDSKGVDVVPVLQANGGQARGLLVGVNDYERLKDLNFCEADVTALRDRLVEIGFEPKAVKCLTTGDPDATRRPSFRNINEHLDALFAGLDEDSVLVIALSGHGGSFEWKDAAGGEHTESFFCPLDARLNDPSGTMISVRGIYRRLEECPARFKLLLTDACRDRHFVPQDAHLAGRTAIDEAKSMAGFADSLKSLNDPRRLPKGTLAMVSCSSGEQSWEDRNLRHGIFMYYVLKALAGEADREYRGDRNNVVCFREFRDYVYRKTSDHAWRAHGGASQTPSFYAKWELPDFDLVEVLRGEPKVYNSWPFDAREARRRQEETSSILGCPVMLNNSIGMKLALIPAGEFMMGSAKSEEDRESDESPQHRVRITRPFYLGVYEVTQEQYEKIMGKNPSSFKGVTRPVEEVSWDDAVEFCRRLSAKEGKEYRLPTEAEWEYACRAGTTTRYSFGDKEESLGNYAWFSGNAEKGTHPVGQKRPNPWGLHDMHGNVWEWCADWFDSGYYAASPKDDPRGPGTGEDRVLRGGSWYFVAKYARSANRGQFAPGKRYNNDGLRLARSP